jgi:hypothetical protein
LLLAEVRVVVQQEDEAATLDELVRGGLASEGSTHGHQEVFGE